MENDKKKSGGGRELEEYQFIPYELSPKDEKKILLLLSKHDKPVALHKKTTVLLWIAVILTFLLSFACMATGLTFILVPKNANKPADWDDLVPAEKSPFEFRVNFANDDGTFLWGVDTPVGQVPKYEGPIPSKISTDDYVYDIDIEHSWDKPLLPYVEGKVVYKASFTKLSNNLKYEMNKDGESVSVIGFQNQAIRNDKVIINSEYKGSVSNNKIVPITSVCKLDDKVREDVTSVLISDNVEVIKESAFSNFVNLDNVVWSTSAKYSNLREMERYAFFNAGKLNSIGVIIPESVSTIESGAFSSSNIEKITLPKRLNVLDSSTLSFCPNLVKVKLNDGLVVISHSAFENSEKLLSIDIPSSVTMIGPEAFKKCTGLRNITFNNGSLLRSIGSSAFMRCSSLSSITLPDSVKELGQEIFYGCTGIKSVTLSKNMDTVPESAFVSCTSISSIIGGSNIIFVKATAFYATNISEIYFPGSVRFVGERVVGYCRELKSISCGSESNGFWIESWSANWRGECSIMPRWNDHSRKEFVAYGK